MKYALILALLMQGCAAHTYRPLVDRPGATYEEDLRDCQNHAEGEMGAGTGAVVGIVLGGIIGAVLGHQLGLRDEGAKWGATLGGIRGASDGATNQMDIVRRCMAGRGHSVLR